MFCKFPSSIFHHWNNWEVIDKGDIGMRVTRAGKPIEGSDRVIGKFVYQQRSCVLCGKTELHHTKSKLW